jgi:prevent-host-death family protein
MSAESGQDRPLVISVAEAKARFSEMIERVQGGERLIVSRRGRPVLALVPPAEAEVDSTPRTGLASIAGALSDWDELPQVVDEIYRLRRRARDRPAPDLD